MLRMAQPLPPCINTRSAVASRRFNADRGMHELTGATRGPRDGSPARNGQEYLAGTPAPASAAYETVNLFGRRTGHRIMVEKGEPLPALPRGFTWLLVED